MLLHGASFDKKRNNTYLQRAEVKKKVKKIRANQLK